MQSPLILLTPFLLSGIMALDSVYLIFQKTLSSLY